MSLGAVDTAMFRAAIAAAFAAGIPSMYMFLFDSFAPHKKWVQRYGIELDRATKS
jgi:hypothetical protein